MIVPMPIRLRGMWEVIRQCVQGRAKVAREREDRTTAEMVLRSLEDGGGLWMDRDGKRFRLIIRPAAGAVPTSGQADVLRCLERGSNATLDR